MLQARIFNDFALTYQAATVKYRQLIAGIYIRLARFAFAGVFLRKLPAKSPSPSMVAARNGYTLAQRLVAHLNSASNRTGRAATRNHHVF
ncbi:MAG: hypothetical protein HKO71_08810 [Pseudomonadales bacterium]|nr:hypothetical protein [Gammaproteobacteria bacterium]NNL57841.1 hypothetical protein [Pseudomonadales bacterium]